MPRTYSYGYTPGVRKTESQLNNIWSWVYVHPEFRRRSIAMFDAAQDAGADLGFGSGARDASSQLAEALRRHYVVPCSGNYDRQYKGKCYKLRAGMSPYAFPGSSNHETGILNGYALAIDYVGWENGWFDRNCERFGILNFGGRVGKDVNGEEWHGQPIELPITRSDINAFVSKGGKLTIFPLPNYVPPAPLPPPAPPVPPVPQIPTIPDLPPIYTKEQDMLIIDLNPDTPYWVSMLLSGSTLMHISNGHHVSVMVRGGVPRVKLGSLAINGEGELDGILRSVKTTNKSPFAFGMPSYNENLHTLWNLANYK